ncbi:sodium-dependent phosphate transport protein 3-like isoform X1 [Dromiciops gliroides]|uniref:sodium-dependent phosphate transport protein 3-like isoform X1 n=1 Tax=Dromiciops gliroides TaxID=33562 RepID=UPI001CC7AD91|nr:sodium-dependent phosphate transport protein 3-like isoform X1 [Dromiciops gliroides]
MCPLPDANVPEKGSATLQNVQHDGQLPPNKGFCSLRYIQATILFFCSTITFSQATSLAIAIIPMVNNTGQHNQSSVSYESHPEDPGVPVYNWDPEIQGIILSSFSYGSILTLIPSGYLVGKLGARKTLGCSLIMTSLLTVLTPLSASQGEIWIILTRVIQGIFQGAIYPSFPTFLLKWAPPKERSRLFGIVSSGLLVANIFSFSVGGLISYSLTWPYIFYIFGIIGFVCDALVFLLVYDNPMIHPYISESEKEYIISSLPKEDTPIGWSIPLKAMARSLPLWAIFITSFCSSYFITSMILSLPILIDNIFDSDIINNGFLSTLPSLAALIFLNIGSPIADFITSRNILSPVIFRKTLTFLGMLPGSTLFIAVPYVSKYIGISFITFSFGMCILNHVSLQVNLVEVASRYSSFLSGISQFFGTTAGAIVPGITGFFINQDPINGWKNVFFISAAIMFSGMIIFLIFGHAEIQDWAKARNTRVTQF